MKVTAVRVVPPATWDRTVLAYADIELDHVLAVHELRLLTVHDRLQVSMPQRETTDRCPCGRKNQVSWRFCPRCGLDRGGARQVEAADGEAGRRWHDVVHPLNRPLRAHILDRVRAEYLLQSAARPEVAGLLCHPRLEEAGYFPAPRDGRVNREDADDGLRTESG